MSPLDASMSRALRAVPSTPRRPGHRARKLIFAYQASQKAFGLVGLIFLVAGLPFVFAFAGQVPSDLAIALTGRPATGRVLVAETRWTASSSSPLPGPTRSSCCTTATTRG